MVKKPRCTCQNATSLFSIIEKKWVLFILYVLDKKASSFTEIRKSIGEANTKILTDRLRELAAYGLVVKNADGIYQLSDQGALLTQKILKITKWWGSDVNSLSKASEKEIS